MGGKLFQKVHSTVIAQDAIPLNKLEKIHLTLPQAIDFKSKNLLLIQIYPATDSNG